MDYAAQPINNCFHSSTKIVTDLGVKSFSELYDGEVIKVKDKDGIWREATVRSYGSQKMNEVVLVSGRSKEKIICTSNHRWILKDGTVTTSLKVGDTLIGLKDSTEYEPKTLDELRAFCFGFIIGDGSDVLNKGNFLGTRVRLCGKKKDYEHYFIKAGYKRSSSDFDNGDIIMMNKKSPSKKLFLESESWNYLPLNEKIALFHGFYLADGARDSNRLSTSSEKISNMVKDISALAGYYISNISETIHDTVYKKGARLINFRFRRKQNPNNLWKVKSIEKYDKKGNRSYTSWCVEEPITHTFTLASGIVTGNCCLINLEDMLQNGTFINGVKINKPHKLLTATTIATQIILGVSSSQFGGSTITLTHLAPFVRDSYNMFFKKYKDAGLDEETCKKLADIDVKKEIRDSMQTLNYQLNSMTNSNGRI